MVTWKQKELNDLQSPVFWRDVVVEVVCSYMLIFFLASVQLVYSDFQMTPTHAGILMGLNVFAIIESFGHMSGAHMNPAVTLLFLLKRQVTFSRTLFYWIAQVAGGAAGAGCIYAFATEEKRRGFKPMQPAEGTTLLQGIGVEIALTFFLCVAILGSGDNQERKHRCPLPGLPVGCMVAVDIMAGATWTGAAMNPLIALGPEILTGNFDYYWIYWLAPFIGAILAFLVYSMFSAVERKYGIKEKEDRFKQERLEEIADMLSGLLNKEENGNTKILLEKIAQSNA